MALRQKIGETTALQSKAVAIIPSFYKLNRWGVLGMTAKELAVAYAKTVPHDISVPRLSAMIRKSGCKTIEDVREMLGNVRKADCRETV